MNFDSSLKVGEVIDNEKLQAIFKCSGQGGMRRSHQTNTLVVVSDHTKSLYDDRWVSDVFHYTGMGREGDQSLDFAQNKTLAQSQSNGVEVHLFEVFDKGKYTFIGQVELAGEPYLETQPDVNENPRQVWVFPLKVAGKTIMPAVPESDILKNQRMQERYARRMSDEDLLRRVKYERKGRGPRRVLTVSYQRSAYVAEFAKRRAKGTCQLCDRPAPFRDKKEEAYLETHHIKWLSRGGEDAIENTVALCPNCHRKMHSLNTSSDRRQLEAKAKP